MRIILFFIMLLISVLSFAQDGFQYATTGNEVDYYYRIESSNFLGHKEIWLKYDKPSKKVKTKSGKYVTKGGGYTMAFMNISCSSKTHQTNNIINYDVKGNVTGRDDIPTFPKPIVPGSVIEEIARQVCSKE